MPTDFATLAALTHAVECMKNDLVMDFVHRRINMTEFNRRIDELDAQIDLMHVRYITLNRIVEQVPDTLQSHELIHFHVN